MRQTISSLLLGFAAFIAAMVLERYVSAVPEWGWRLIGLGCAVAGIAGAILSDAGLAYLRSTRASVLYGLFAVMFAALGVAFFGLVVRQWLEPPRPGVSPTIELSHELFKALPLVIPPQQTVQILRFPQDRNPSLLRLTNNNADESLQWPQADAIGNVLRVRLTNQDAVAVFNVALKLKIEYHEPGARLFKSTFQDVFVDTVRPAQPFILYCVNQSSYVVTLRYPREAFMRVEGERERRLIQLAPRVSGTDLDLAPPIVLPSLYEWSGDKPVRLRAVR